MSKNTYKLTIKIIISLALFVILGSLVTGLYAKHKRKTTYLSQTNILLEKNFSNRNVQNTTVLANINMMDTYKDMAEDPLVYKEAHNLLTKKLKRQITEKELKESIDIGSKPNSLILNVRATTNSKKKSVAIVNATSSAICKEIAKNNPQMGEVQILSKARNVNVVSKTTPSLKKYIVLGGALGLLVGMIITLSVVSWNRLL